MVTYSKIESLHVPWKYGVRFNRRTKQLKVYVNHHVFPTLSLNFIPTRSANTSSHCSVCLEEQNCILKICLA